jgi:hypothetical protein
MKTNSGTDWQPTDEQLLGWQHAYPEVDVFAELNVMAVWLESNEPKRKTERGMPRFVNSWLSRANQKGGSPFAQEAEKESGKIPMKAWTELDSCTHDFTQSESYRKYCLERFGQYVTFSGERVTR